MNRQKLRHELKKEINRIEEEIIESEREINRLSDEIDDIYDIKRQSDSEYGEIIEYWKGSSSYRRIYESNDRREIMLRRLILSREENLKYIQEKKKKLAVMQEDLLHEYITLEEV